MKSTKRSKSESTSSEDDDVSRRLERILARLDTIIVLLFDLSQSKDPGKSVSMTTKVGYLDSLGYDIGQISKMVGRPSNFTSSRLREYKARNEKKGPKRKPFKTNKDVGEVSRDEGGSSE